MKESRHHLFQFNRRYFLLALLLFAVEVYIATSVNDHFVRPFVGDYLVVILLYAFLRAFWNTSVRRAALSVLVFSYVLEILQYFKLVELLHLEHIRWARIVIGTSFAWEDLVAYFLGIATVFVVESFRPS